MPWTSLPPAVQRSAQLSGLILSENWLEGRAIGHWKGLLQVKDSTFMVFLPKGLLTGDLVRVQISASEGRFHLISHQGNNYSALQQETLGSITIPHRLQTAKELCFPGI